MLGRNHRSLRNVGYFYCLKPLVFLFHPTQKEALQAAGLDSHQVVFGFSPGGHESWVLERVAAPIGREPGVFVSRNVLNVIDEPLDLIFRLPTAAAFCLLFRWRIAFACSAAYARQAFVFVSSGRVLPAGTRIAGTASSGQVLAGEFVHTAPDGIRGRRYFFSAASNLAAKM